MTGGGYSYQQVKKGAEILARRAVRANAIELVLFHHNGKGETSVGSVHLRTVQEGECVDPTAVISIQEAQALLDELWNCGIRPSDGNGNVGQLGATERHLSDMRKLVSHFMPGVTL